MPFAAVDLMAAKRAYSSRTPKKGNTRRKLRASGLEWFVVDQTLMPPEQAPRGHRKVRRPTVRRAQPGARLRKQ